MEFNYFYGNEQEQYIFVQVPLLLIKDEYFKKLSSDAKLLYSLLLNRTKLSVKNNWHDEKGRVYIIYTINEIKEDLNCASQKACGLLDELEKIGLIEKKRQGLNKANLIYVKDYTTVLKYKKDVTKADKKRNFENQNSGILKIKIQELRKSKSIKNYTNKKDINNIDVVSQCHSQCHSHIENQKKDIDKMTMTNDNLTNNVNNYPKKNFKTTLNKNLEKNTKKEGLIKSKSVQTNDLMKPSIKQTVKALSFNNNNNYNIYSEKIKENICYNDLIRYEYKYDRALIDEFISNMLDVICSCNEITKINGEQKSTELVKSMYLKIDYEEFKHCIDQFKNVTTKIIHKSAYIKTMLYNVKLEMESHYTNLVNYNNCNENSPVKQNERKKKKEEANATVIVNNNYNSQPPIITDEDIQRKFEEYKKNKEEYIKNQKEEDRKRAAEKYKNLF